MIPRKYEKWGKKKDQPWICGKYNKLTKFNNLIQDCIGPQFPDQALANKDIDAMSSPEEVADASARFGNYVDLNCGTPT